MGVLPVCTGLVQCIKLVQEALIWFYGALSNTRSAISPVRLSLEYTMPVLPIESVSKRTEIVWSR